LKKDESLGAQLCFRSGHMEVEVLESKSTAIGTIRRENSEKDRVRVKTKTLQTVLEQCQRALELLNTTGGGDDDEDDDSDDAGSPNVDDEQRGESSGSLRGDREADEVWNFVFVRDLMVF
jgi:hypothetical protein